MKIAVVILNWNGAQLLKQFLPKIIQFSPEATIYVADNASTDESIEVLKNHFPEVKIITNSHNYGFAKGYNEALKNVEADVFALVNSDIEVTPGWLKPIIDTFQTEKNTAIIQPKILDYKDKSKFEYAGAAGGFIDAYGFPFCRGRIFDTLEEDQNQYDDVVEIFWASGACFFIRSEIYKELKGFDESFFAHQEEIDLCWRAFNNNFIIKYIPHSVVYHIGGATLQQGNPKKTYLNFRNSLFMLTKNLPKNKLYSRLFIRLSLDGLAGLQFILQGKPKHCLAILKAHFSFYQHFNSNYSKRQKNQKENYYKTKSIVYSYFIRNGKVFGKIF
ncbi:glycosyltransferase family 2 protein [Flavobacterium sp.]|uniref:glycosyltransferase family 2 protein n=1 Tax=Flavobacterium sp. TaxID=239 RepID=UPI0026339006|nr:glycosyltransferase family 2 protein [Flavobacterium sp.]MDD3005148.1 glycosyltransferase family 2 protein [Flavobacterium sp.]